MVAPLAILRSIIAEEDPPGRAWTVLGRKLIVTPLGWAPSHVVVRLTGRLKPKNDVIVIVVLAPISLCSVRVREDVDAEMEKS